MNMKEFLVGLVTSVRMEIAEYASLGRNRGVLGDSPGGDAQFDIDEVAEKAVFDYVKNHSPIPIALYTEDQSFIEFGVNPKMMLIVDPIDGTRPTSAGFEMGMISVACAPLENGQAYLGNVCAAILMEIKSGNYMYGDDDEFVTHGYQYPVPSLSKAKDLNTMFWSLEFNGHPMELMTKAYSHIVDLSANSGGVFVFSSASFSISRIITGQLDAYVDIGNRILKDHPSTEAAFRKAGRGTILHLFPYDIAASIYLAKKAGVVITDAYGRSLDGTSLIEIDFMNQQSCLATSTKELHQALTESINWNL